MLMDEKDIKVITLGESGVGKTSIINRIKGDGFNEAQLPTFEILDSFTLKKTDTKRNLTINLIFHDTAGQENLANKLPMNYIRNSKVVLLVFCNIESLKVIKERWYTFYQQNTNTENPRFILIGNKSDIFGDKRDEIIKQGQEFADEIDAHFMTCSAKSDDNLDNITRYILREAKRIIDEDNIKKEQKEKEEKERKEKEEKEKKEKEEKVENTVKKEKVEMTAKKEREISNDEKSIKISNIKKKKRKQCCK